VLAAAGTIAFFAAHARSAMDAREREFMTLVQRLKDCAIHMLDLDVPVLAEGLESADQLDLLRAEGCDEAQGSFFGRPCVLDLAEIDRQEAHPMIATLANGPPHRASQP